MNIVMRPVIATLFVTWFFFLTTTAQASDKPALLFIVDGQSNAGTHGDGSEISNDWNQPQPDTLFYSPQATGHNRWNPVAPFPYTDAKFSIDGSGFGIELSFVKKVKQAYPNHIIALARRSKGGTSIVAWDKNHSTNAWSQAMSKVANSDTEPQYPQLMSFANAAKTSLAQQPGIDSVTFGGFLWIQVERDSKYKYGADNYETNLTNLIANVRQDWNSPTLPVVFMEAHTNANGHMATVDQAVRAVERKVARTGLVLVKDLSTHDNVHFDTQGTLDQGNRYADAYLDIIGQPISEITPTVTSTPQELAGDFDGNGEITLADLHLLINNFASRDTIYDLTGDGKVTIFDFNHHLTLIDDLELSR